MNTHSTVEISQCLKEYGLDLSPNTLKNIDVDNIFQIYCALLEALDYKIDSFTQALPNFEALEGLRGDRENYYDIIPLVNFGMILNNVLTTLNFPYRLSHYDLHFPNWKQHRLIVSVLLSYVEYVNGLKPIYQELGEEYVRKSDRRNELKSEIRNLTEKINENKGIISRKKNVENVQQLLDEKVAEFAAVSEATKREKEKYQKAKKDLEDKKTEYEKVIRELTQLEAEEKELNSLLVTDQDLNELKELEEKLSKVKLEFNYKNVEEAALKNKNVVDLAKNPNSLAASLNLATNKFDEFYAEVQRLENNQAAHKAIKLKRKNLENQLNAGTKKLSSLKEEKIDVQNCLSKDNSRMKEALKDKMLVLKDLENQLAEVLEVKRREDERERELVLVKDKLIEDINHLDKERTSVIDAYHQVQRMYNQWERKKLEENKKFVDHLESTKKMCVEKIKETLGCYEDFPKMK